MTCVYGSRWSCVRKGAMSMTITESSGATYTITASATTAYSFTHGDSTDDTTDGVATADDGTICFGVWLEDVLNSAAAALANDYTVAFAPTTGIYTISRSAGAATFLLAFAAHGAAGRRFRQALGMDGDKSTATSQTGTRAPHYWLIAEGDRSDYSDRQPSAEVVRGTIRYTSSGARFGVAPPDVPYQLAWVQRFNTRALCFNSQDSTTDGDVWTWERFFDHHRDGERFTFWGSTVVGTSAVSWATRDRAYTFSQAGIDGWRIERVIGNSNLYWDVAFDCVEHDSGNPTGGASTLLSWADMTFTRGSVATYRTTAATIADAAINEARYENIGDGYETLLLLEGASTNLVTRSESAYLGVGWTLQGCTGLLNAVSPDGTVNGSRLTSDGTGDYARTYIASTHSGSIPITFSAWYREGAQNTGAHTHAMGLSEASYSVDAEAYSAGWVRGDKTVASCQANSSPVIHIDPELAAPTAASGDDLIVFGVQSENLRFPSSYIRATAGSTVTRSADTATWADSTATMRSGRWQFIVRPEFGSSDMVSGDIRVFWSFVDANNSVRIRHNGTDIKIEAYAGSSVKASSLAITWSRDQVLRATIDCAGATVTVTGATTGNGVGATGTAWTWATGTLRSGGNVSATGEAFASISLPMAA